MKEETFRQLLPIFIMGGISILPYRLRFYNDSAYYTTNQEFRYGVSYSINEDFRLRICSVLSGVIDDELLKLCHFGIHLPLLIIILRIYIDLTKGSDLEARSLLQQVEPVYHQQIGYSHQHPADTSKTWLLLTRIVSVESALSAKAENAEDVQVFGKDLRGSQLVCVLLFQFNLIYLTSLPSRRFFLNLFIYDG